MCVRATLEKTDARAAAGAPPTRRSSFAFRGFASFLGRRSHSALAVQLRAGFYAKTSLASGAYVDLHIRRAILGRGCNDTTPAAVSQHVRKISRSLPIVIHSDDQSKQYHHALRNSLQPQRVVFSTPVVQGVLAELVKTDNSLPTDNYAVFAAERAIAAASRMAIQLGYKPCGVPRLNWEGVWKPGV